LLLTATAAAYPSVLVEGLSPPPLANVEPRCIIILYKNVIVRNEENGFVVVAVAVAAVAAAKS